MAVRERDVTHMNKKTSILAVLAILCLLLSAAVLFLAWDNNNLKEEAKALRSDWEESQALHQAALTRLEQRLTELEEEGPVETFPEGTPEGTEHAPEEEQLKEIAYLGDIRMVEAGKILEPSQVDAAMLEQYFIASRIVEGDEVYTRIVGKSYPEDAEIPLEELRYLKLLHYNFQGEIQVGEMIVHADIAEDVLQIFQELYENAYQIQSMYLVDNYWAGNGNDTDYASIEANNTSAFNYRPVTGGTHLSNHAYGKAIDINPQQNPYVWIENGVDNWSHANADLYIDRNSGESHMIGHEDTCYRVFAKYGFTWGGDWSNPKDYQHFQRE